MLFVFFFFFLQSTTSDGWTTEGIIGLGGGAIGAILVLGGLVKAFADIRKDGWVPFRDKWITPRRAWRTRQESMFGKVEDLCKDRVEDRAMLQAIHREFKPNGGTTMNDRIASIDDKVENIVAERRHQNETSDLAIFKLDDKGEMVYTNCAFREIVNAEGDQVEHHNYLALMEDADRQRFIRALDEAVKFKMPIDVIAKFKMTGPHFRAIRLQASPDVRSSSQSPTSESMLKGFFGTAIEAKVE